MLSITLLTVISTIMIYNVNYNVDSNVMILNGYSVDYNANYIVNYDFMRLTTHSFSKNLTLKLSGKYSMNLIIPTHYENDAAQ